MAGAHDRTRMASGLHDMTQVLLARLKRLVTADPDESFGVPGAIFAVACPNGDHAVAALGSDAAGVPLGESTFLTLASTSKLALGLVMLRLVERGAIELDAELSRYLPEAEASRSPDVTIRRLLSHTSGLPLEVRHSLSEPPGAIDWRSGLRWPNELAAACLQTPLATEPCAYFQYSNVGYGLLALVAERVTGRTSGELVQEEVATPLGIDLILGDVPEQPMMALADVPGPYAGGKFDPYLSRSTLRIGLPWRGMVSNIRGLLQLVRAYGDHGGLIDPTLARVARGDQVGGVSGGYRTTEAFLGIGPSRRIVWDQVAWGLAVEVQGGKEPHWAPSWLPRSVGQIGSTGCLAWYDPDSHVAWAIAGARTTEKGWLIRHGTRIAQSAFEAAGVSPPSRRR